MKKQVQFLYVLLVLCGILLPLPLFPALKGMLDTSNYENRNLEDAPQLSVDNWENFPGQFDAYFQDHIPFRNQLVRTNMMLDYYVMKDTASRIVTIGRDGWLFYGGRIEETASLHDYIADELFLFTDDQLEQMRSNLARAEEELNAQGTRLIVMLVPDKHRVYPEYYPEYMGTPGYPNRITQIADYLREHSDITVLSAYDALMEYRQEDPDLQLYWRYDTHWNLAGSYLASSMVNEELGITMPPLSDLSHDEVMTGHYDLSKMMMLETELTYDQNYTFFGYSDHIPVSESDPDGPGTIYQIEDSSGDPRTVLLCGDSFSNVMVRYIACNYNTTVHVSRLDVGLDELEEYNPDVIVLELCERNFGDLLHMFLD